VNRAAELQNGSPTRAARVDPVGTRRRLQALACLGWDMVQLGELSDVPVDRLRAIANDAAPQRGISSHTASAVARTYAALSAKPPSARSARGRCAERRATLRRTWKRAAAAGWLPPMSWTPDTIDEPTADPLPIDAAAALAELIPMIVYNGWAARLPSPMPEKTRPLPGRHLAAEKRSPSRSATTSTDDLRLPPG